MIPSIILTLLFGASVMAQPQKAQPKRETVMPAAPVAPAPTAIPVVPVPPQSSGDSPLEAILNEDLIKSLRDPFQLPTSALVKKELPKSDLEAFALKDFKLNGVITGPRKVRAMLSGPANKTYFVKIGDRIGVRGGKVTHIMSDAVRVTEYYQDEHGKDQPDVYELRLTGEMVSLTKKDGEAQ